MRLGMFRGSPGWSAAALTAAILLSPVGVFGRTWYVLPDSTGDARTIQAAIDSSSDGDSVLVAAGTYYVNLKIQQKDDLSLVSESGPEVTVLDGRYPAEGATIRWQVIRCQLSSNTLIEGFTIQEGSPEGLQAKYGGGILLGGGRTTVRGNIIQNNENLYGGGIGFGQNAQYMEGTVIEENLIRWNMGTEGCAGVYAASVAGPIYIRDNTFLENLGMAVHASSSHFVVEDNVCERNSSEFGVIGIGSGNCVARRNIVIDNLGYGIAGYGSVVEENTVVGNTGRGLWLTWVDVRRNLVASNGLEGIKAMDCGEVSCNDSWGNLGGDYAFAAVSDTSGNISEDPLFCDPEAGDYTLASESPCAPANSGGCGRIGALDVGCVFTGVAAGSGEPASWGAIKRLFR